MFRLRHNPVILRSALIIFAGSLFVLLTGCARFPSNATPITGKRLTVTMTVAGEINPNYHYYVAFDTSGTATPGPLPAIGPPWGNGWGTGSITHFVVFDALQPQGGYGVYRILTQDLTGSTYLGPPLTSVIPPSGANKLQFTIDLGQLASPTLPADQITTVNVNFITTDVLPLAPTFPGPKYYDALGQTGSSFVTIQVQANQTYSNSQTDIEQAGDVQLPDLDITDWSIQVQNVGG